MIRFFLIFTLLCGSAWAETARWTEAKAKTWYAAQPWLVGANYNPASAINQLEMWDGLGYNPAEIDKELGWAESIGMNTMRVFLHDLLWLQDPIGFQRRLDDFLKIAAKHNIKPMFVLFDSCWDPAPKLGQQRPPKPGVHNSGWVQSPGAAALRDLAQEPRLAAYVRGVVGAFRNDKRVLAWDIWNEPDNTNDSSYGALEPRDKAALVLQMLPKAFDWARQADPSQPLTSGVWQGDWSSPAALSPMAKVQLNLSDITTFHNYDDAAEFEKRVKWLQQYNRPILCTEYMARGNKSTFEAILPVARKYNVAAINWGLVAGKTQTYLPWDSWKKAYVDREPAVWHHEVFHKDGKPYRKEETDLIRKMTSEANATRKAA